MKLYHMTGRHVHVHIWHVPIHVLHVFLYIHSSIVIITFVYYKNLLTIIVD